MEQLALQKLLQKTQQKLSPPIVGDDLKKKWVAAIYFQGKQRQLIFGRVIERLDHDDNGVELDPCMLHIDCCKPCHLPSLEHIIEEVPGGDPWHFDLKNIIFAYITVDEESMIAYEQNKKWKVKNMQDVINIFNDSKKLDLGAMSI